MDSKAEEAQANNYAVATCVLVYPYAQVYPSCPPIDYAGALDERKCIGITKKGEKCRKNKKKGCEYCYHHMPPKATKIYPEYRVIEVPVPPYEPPTRFTLFKRFLAKIF